MRSTTEIPTSDTPRQQVQGSGKQRSEQLAEIEALLKYSVSRGIDPDGKIIKKLVPLVSKAAQEPQALSSEDNAEILTLYSQLNRITPDDVTGRTLLDSRNNAKNLSVRRVTWVTWYIVFPLIILSAALDLWIADGPEPEGGWQLYVVFGQRYVLGALTPFLWGALGSCVYLLKRYSDLAESHTFDADSLQGWGTRITLGAILGGAVQYLYDPTAFTGAELALDASALGFLTGVGVRVVYGAIEKTVDALATAMNIDAIRKAKSEQIEVRRYLNEQLASLGDSPEEEQKRAVLVALLADLKAPEARA